MVSHTAQRAPREVSDAKRDGPPGVVRVGALAGLGVLLVSYVWHAAVPVSDPDTLWHVLAGRYVASTGQLSGPDPLSGLTGGSWVLNQWAAELAFAGADAVGGLAAVMWLVHLARLALVVVIYFTCRAVAGELAGVVATVVACLAAAGALGPRPQLFGLVLFAIAAAAWWRTMQDGRPRWWLVPLTWVWACTHGTWVFGVLLGAAVAAGTALESRRPRRLRLVLVPAASFAAALVTPLGPRLLSNMADIRAIAPYITEWAHPSAGSWTFLVAMAMAAVVGITAMRAAGHVGWDRLAVLVLAVVLVLTYRRTVAFGAVLLAPLVAAAIQSWFHRTVVPPRRGEGRAVLGAVAVSLALAAAVLPLTARADGPDAFDRTLHSLRPGSVVFNVDVVGGWLMWAHPALRPTSDTRAELYGPDGLRDYAVAMSRAPGWQAVFDRHAPAAAVLPAGSPLVDALKHERGWREAGTADGLVLLLPSGT